MRDFRTAGLEERLVRMLSFVETLTGAPGAIGEDDIEGLRRVGYDDVGILHVVLGSSQFNYLNRVADGVGIPLDYRTEIEPAPVPEGDGEAGAPAGRARRPRSTPVGAPRSQVPQDAADPERVAWIACPPGEAAAPDDGPANLFRVMAPNPRARDLARAWRAYHLQATPALDARQRAGIALFVAGLSGAAYSARWFRHAFERAGGAPGDADDLGRGEVPSGASEGPANAGSRPTWTEGDRLALKHAQRLTLAPWTTRREHVDALRGAGLGDRDTLQLTTLVSYVSFEVRVALGLGVTLERRATA
jgi:uncharacterized protein YciW